MILAIHAALATGQPIFAGALLSRNADAIDLHAARDQFMHLTCFAQLPITVLFWRPGRVPLWPAWTWSL